MYFNVNFNLFFKWIKVHLLVTELYIYRNARCNDKNSWSISKTRTFRYHQIIRNVVRSSVHWPDCQFEVRPQWKQSYRHCTEAQYILTYVFVDFSKIFLENSSLIKTLTTKTGTLRKYLSIFVKISLWILLIIRNFSDKFVEKSKHTFYLQ